MNTIKHPAFVMLLLLLLLALTACASSPVKDGGESESETSAQTEESVKPIMTAALASYSLIRSEDASSEIRNACGTLSNTMKQDYALKEYKDDFYKEGNPDYAIGEYEILVGNTNRPESIQLASEMKRDDYGYAQIGKKIVIVGGSDAATVCAIEAFTEEILGASHTDGVFFSPEKGRTVKGSYPVANLTLGGIPVRDFTVVYPAKGENGEQTIAEQLVALIADLSGDVLQPQSDKKTADGNLILIGKTAMTAESEIDAVGWLEGVARMKDGNLLMLGKSGTALGMLFDALKSLAEEKQGEAVDLSFDPALRTLYDDSVLSAMSFNVWVSEMTEERVNRVLTMIETYSPDTFGVQEASVAWMQRLKDAFGKEYAFVGQGRDGGENGEHSAIFYKKALFECTESGTKWMSDTPDTVASKYPDSAYPRIMTYAILTKRSTGERFAVVNTHLDHKGAEAKKLQAKFLAEYAKNWDCPIVLTGDFNSKKDTEVYATMIAGKLDNAYDLAEEKINNAHTFTNFGAAGRIIDYIFVSNVKVKSYRVCDEKIDGDWPSDHHPVLITYCLNSAD